MSTRDIDRAELLPAVAEGLRQGWRFGTLVADEDRLDYVFVVPGEHRPEVLRLSGVGGTGSAPPPSISLACPAASWAEREVKERFGVAFADMPDPRPLLDHSDEKYPFRHVEGEGVMEVRVGPIHAGIIEPGHFRFSTVGETVLGLEVRLGYVHRGVEKLGEGMAPAAAIALGERVSGTASVAHALALARALEAALGLVVPPAAALLRCLLLELERIYNHAGDIGNLCAGTALTGLLAEGLIIKERLLRANERLTGSRWLRNQVAVGGVRRAPPFADIEAAVAAAAEAMAATETLAAKFFASASNLERLTGTGVLALAHARALACVGPVARASGVRTDSRVDLAHPTDAERDAYEALEVPTLEKGDVAARARLRLLEARESLRLVLDLARRLREHDPPAPAFAAAATAAPAGGARSGSGAALGWAEGPRGEILTYARIVAGKLARLRVRSPSRMNWPAIEHAMPGNIVPDFPLINKSFNLSYAGCDL
jgi:Ni,Fe-hydrogenase III large subunit